MIDLATRIALSPLLLAQAVAVRRRALHLPEAAGPRSGTTGIGPALRLLILGDSSAAGVGARTQDHALAGRLVAALAPRARINWRVIARSGATTGSTLRALGQQEIGPADVVVTALGVNDVTHAVPRALWLRRQRLLLALLERHTGARRIYVSGIPPMGALPILPQPLRFVLGRQARAFDAALAGMVRAHPVARHVAFDIAPDPLLLAPDGMHPAPALYALWGEKLASRIIADWPAIRP